MAKTLKRRIPHSHQCSGVGCCGSSPLSNVSNTTRRGRRTASTAPAKPKFTAPKSVSVNNRTFRVPTKRDLERIKNFTPKNVPVAIEYAIAIAIVTQRRSYPNGMNPALIPPSQILQMPKIQNMLRLCWQISADQNARKEWQEGGFDLLRHTVKKNFFGIDIMHFQDDMEDCYNRDLLKHGYSYCFRRILLYLLRVLSKGCCVDGCDVVIGDDMTYGGPYKLEWDHALENLYDMIGTIFQKEFEWNIGATSRSFVSWLMEYAKTLPTCHCHHNRLGVHDLRYEDMLRTPEGLYGLINDDDDKEEEIDLNDCNPLSPAQVQASAEGKAMQRATDSLLECNLRDVSWSEVVATYKKHLPFLEHIDVCFINEDIWDGADVKQRKYAIKQTERQITKRLCRVCMICRAPLLTIAGREMTGKHNHHVDESQKKFNPSEGPMKDINKQRKEDRKTVCICGGCHLGVTHSHKKDAAFKLVFHNLGFYTRPSDGEILCHKAQDSYRVVNKNASNE